MAKKDTERESVSWDSADLTEERAEKLKQLFPDAFTEGKVDFEKLRQSLGDLVDDRPERYSFTWAGKRDAIRLLQTPSRATLIPAPEESVNFDTTQNLFIEGDNLEVLKLLYKSYAGRVKMIYIDPPYNTGNEFVYPDNFTDPLDTYLKLTNQTDGNGNYLTSNSETNGRYHSAWLSMIYPRLFVARQLLREDGVLFISIDDHEVNNLRLLLNEIFGEENLLACITWKRRQVPDNRNINNVSIDHEYVLAYGRGSATFTGKAKDLSKYTNPDNDPRGPWMSDNMTGLATKEQRPNLHYNITNPETGITYPPHPGRGWAYEPKRMDKLISEGCVLWPRNNGGRPRLKRFLADIKDKATGFSTVQSPGYTTDGTREVTEIMGFKAFDFPKPISLIKMLLNQVTTPNENAIVLDFFAGSATTADAVMRDNIDDEGNRRFILIQLPEPTSNDTFPTIAEIGKERIRRVINKMKISQESEDLGFKVFKLAESNYRQWSGVEEKDPEKYAETMELFADPFLSGWKPESVIYEVALKEGYSLTSTVEELKKVTGNTVYRVTDPDKDQSFLICLDSELKTKTVKALNLEKDTVFICRDSALTDELAANIALQCHLKTI